MKFKKDALRIIAFYITCIINTSIVTGVFPTAWKYAFVIPHFKIGNISDLSNFRPISLLPIVSKVSEKVVANQLIQCLEYSKLLSNTQHGLRPKLSIETALIIIADNIYDNMDQKKITVLTV